MKKDYIQDYLGYIIVKALGPLIRLLPLNLSFFIGRTIGRIFYIFDLRHRALVYANIKQAMGNKLLPQQISKITRNFYLGFGQNIIETFLLPLADKKYFDKYIAVEGRENITEAFKKQKGVILLGMHAGGWEISNVVCANLGFTFNLLVRDQGLPRLNKLLNAFRHQKGCKLIQRDNLTRGLIEALKNNEAIGMTADQGGKAGEIVRFFGKEASMPAGAIKLAMRYDSVILPAFYTRIKGPFQKVIISRAFNLNKNISIQENIQALMPVFEQLIMQYPQEYFWRYKIWKYSKEKNILILSDGKTGHLRQAQAVAKVIKETFCQQEIRTNIDFLEIKFKNKFSRCFLALSSCLSGQYSCQGCMWCLKKCLENDNFKSIITIKPDIIVSCGSSLAPINFILAKENLAKSVVVMRPSILSTRRFDLVIMPRHDHPPKRKNVLAMEGALNLIDDNYLKEQAEELLRNTPACRQAGQHATRNTNFSIGLLIGGNTKNFQLVQGAVGEVIGQVKSACQKYNAAILATTSRRTPAEIEKLLQDELNSYPYCKMLVIANEKNPAFTVGGILALSEIIIISPESISMISEAVSSKKYVVVFSDTKLDKKHRDFLDYFAKNKYIYLVKPDQLSKTLEYLEINKPLIKIPDDNYRLSEACKRLL